MLVEMFSGVPTHMILTSEAHEINR